MEKNGSLAGRTDGLEYLMLQGNRTLLHDQCLCTTYQRRQHGVLHCCTHIKQPA
jgi:hypothetical protein